MAEEAKDPGVSGMLDAIRRRDLLENNVSEDGRWVEVDGEIAGAPFQIRVLLPLDRWSSPNDLLACPAIALRYESRMTAWNLDYMVEAFDAIYGRHPTISGPWVTVVRTGDRRTYHGRDAWDMNRVASMFRTQHGLKPSRGGPRGSDESEGEVEEDVVRVEIQTLRQITRGIQETDTALEFHRDGAEYGEVVRFGAGAVTAGGSEFLGRVLQNVLWGTVPSADEVARLRASVADLVALLRP